MKIARNKIKYFLVVLFIFQAVYIYADNAQQDSALIYYSNSEYQGALDIYLSFIEDGKQSWELYYNIGNCFYKIYDIPSAILWYERAKLLNPSNPDIINNLDLANSMIKDKVDSLPKVFYVAWYNDTLNLFSSNQWAMFSIVSFLFFLISLGIFLFSGRIGIKKSFFFLCIPAFLLAVFSLMFSIQQKNKIINSNHAIIFESSLVKSAPDEASSNLFEINEGLKVEILESLNSWIHIRLADGKQGWIPVENSEKI